MSTNEISNVKPSSTDQPAALHNLRKRKKAEGRKKKAQKLQSNKEFAKSYFEAKSKRSTEKKSAFRKKKSKKK